MSQLSPVGGGPAPGDVDLGELDPTGAGSPQPPTPQAGVAQNAQPPVAGPPQGLVASMGAQNTDQLTGSQLGQLTANPEDALMQEMEQALQNPQTPPAQKQAIEQQILLAAKRQMMPQASGLGGQ